MCKGCALGSCHKLPIQKSEPHREAERLSRIYIDNCGPISPRSFSGKAHFTSITDDATRLTAVYFIKTRDETLSSLKAFEQDCAKHQDLKIKIIRHDSDKAIAEGNFKLHCLENGIRQEQTVAEQHTQNAVAERSIGVITKMARSAMCHFDVPAGLWPEAVKTACYVRNRLPLDGNPDGKSPLQLWTSSAEPEDLSHLRTFGCYVVFTLTDQERVRGEKFHAIGIEGAFLGYEENEKVRKCVGSGKKVFLPFGGNGKIGLLWATVKKKGRILSDLPVYGKVGFQLETKWSAVKFEKKNSQNLMSSEDFEEEKEQTYIPPKSKKRKERSSLSVEYMSSEI